MSDPTQGAAAPDAGAAQTVTESLLDQVLAETKLTPSDEGYEDARRGVAAFLAELVKPANAESASTPAPSTA